jgi:hypothetical protein
MAIKEFIVAGCSVVILSAGTALAGPFDTAGRAVKDAGSGRASQSTSQTVGIGNDSKHPPTSTMNRASGEVAASSEDAKRQTQGQPTAAQRAQGAKPGAEMATQEAQRQMHAQPSVAKQPKGTEQTDDKGCLISEEANRESSSAAVRAATRQRFAHAGIVSHHTHLPFY